MMPQTKRTKGHTDTQRLNWLLNNVQLTVRDPHGWIITTLLNRREIDCHMPLRKVPK